MPDGLPRIDGEAVVSQVREDSGRASSKFRQPMKQNGATRLGDVDSSNLAQGVWLSDPQQRHGNMRGEVCGR